MRRMLLLLIGFHALLLSFSSPAWSAVFVEPTTLAIDETITVGAGSYSYYSLRLTTGSNLSVRLAVQGGLNNSLRVWLLDLENFQKFQANQEFAYFTGTSGTISNLASYRFSVPKSNIYYLILDNRAALLLLRKASVRVYTTSRQETDESRKIKEAYTALYDRYLKGLFVFPDFDIRVGLCGTENSFSTPDIFICMELNDALSKSGVPGTIATTTRTPLMNWQRCFSSSSIRRTWHCRPLSTGLKRVPRQKPLASCMWMIDIRSLRKERETSPIGFRGSRSLLVAGPTC